MFIGHYSTSFVAKAIAPTVPLWLLLVSAQLVDIGWGLLILGGVERAALDTTLPSNPLVLQHMPFTHSLVATIVWSLIAFAIANKAFRFTARDSLIVALVVASHWFLDLIVHRPDLPLLVHEPKLGFGLWNFPSVAYGLEVLLLLFAVWFCVRAMPVRADRRRVWYGFALLLVIIQSMTSFGPIPTTLSAMVVSALALYIIVPYAGRWVEHHQRRANY
jgi:membrane-bound metal-dependent hydrolase YbcI (DUF457 family)